MEKRAAIALIEQTLNAKFDLEQYTLFLRNLLNDYEERDNAYQGISLWEDYRAHINKYERIGKYTDPDGNEMDLLVVETKSLSKLDRARTSLRNFVVKHLNKFNKDYALAAFYSKEDQGADWRFSFIKIEHESYQDVKGKVKTRKELTPAKRYSFLVGEHEQAHTAQKQLLPVLENDYSSPSVEELESCFSIERVTDEFFEQYKELYLKLSEHFNSDKAVQKILSAAGIETDRFTKKLLGQIVFLYFLQKKGWLGVAKDGKMGDGPKRYLQEQYEIYTSKSKNYFKDFLQYLFYEALAKEHNDDGIKYYYNKLKCKIPFLNGGLFEADYDWQNVALSIPDNLFRNEEKNKAGDKGTGILDIFDRYNFTIKEDEPLEKEVAVDPEMLGKVFENMLEIKERKSKGAFYTPREIVHYMCQESLINYLNSAVNEATESYQPLDSNQTSFFSSNATKKGQTKLEIEHKGKTLVPKEDLEIFIRKGFLATENDQNIIENKEGKETSTYRFKLPDSIRENANLLDEKLTDIKICDPAIGSGAFPVGLLHELVTAQKVLLPYLSQNYLIKKLKVVGLKAAEFKKDPTKYTYRIKRHAIQESIYGVDIDASAIDIARLRLWLSLIVDEDDLENIEALPNLDYKIVKGNSLIGLTAQGADRYPQIKDELEILKNSFFNETDDYKKKALRNKINEKIEQVLKAAEDFEGYKVDFDFKLFFSEVWHYKEGFDVVIGNPPYVFGGSTTITEQDKKIFKRLYHSGSSKINLFALFIEKGHTILSKKSCLCYIVPNTLLRVTSYANIREYLIKRTSIKEIVDLDVGIFKNVTASTIIIRIENTEHLNNLILIKKGLSKPSLQAIPQADLNKKGYVLDIFSSQNDRELLSKLFDNSAVSLGKICKYIRFGVVITGNFNEIVGNKKLNGNWKPFLEGEEVDEFSINYQGRYLNYAKELLHRSRTPDLFEQPKILIQRITGGKHPVKAAFDWNNYYTKESIINIVLQDNQFDYLYVLGILNSEVINWFYAKKFTNFSKLTVNLSKEYLSEIPIRNCSPSAQSTIVTIIKYIITYKSIFSDDIIVLGYLKNLLNACCFEIYFPEELKKSGKEILNPMGHLRTFTENIKDEQKISIIRSEFNRLYDPNHPVRNNIETLDSVDEVRVIKEALK